MKLHFDSLGYPAEDWQRRFLIFDQTGSTCRVVCHPTMSTGAMNPLHETRVLASHGCDNMEENPAIISQVLPSATFPKLLGVNSKGKEVNLHRLNNGEIALSRSLEKCNWKQLEDFPENESASQLSYASNPWRERSEDIDALLSSDEELSTGRSPNMDEKTNIQRTSGLATGELVNKLGISEDEDEEVNSKPSMTCNALHNQLFGKSIESSKAQCKRKMVGLYQRKHKSQGRSSSFKSKLRKDISRNLDLLKEGKSLDTQPILKQAVKLAK